MSRVEKSPVGRNERLSHADPAGRPAVVLCAADARVDETACRRAFDRVLPLASDVVVHVSSDALGDTESFRLDVSVDDEGTTVAEVSASSVRAVQFAFIELHDRLAHAGDDRSPTRSASVEAGPGFGLRGVIEGFYGPPWSTDERRSMIEFVARKRMNAFFYGPKDDPFLRRDWRRSHEGTALDSLQALIAACREWCVDATVGISPGLSIEYSNERDLDLLAAKAEELADLGVDRVVVQLDDIPPRLQHPADRSGFADLADAHVAVVNTVARRLRRRDVGVAMCPTVYRGDVDDPYLRTIGASLDGEVDVMFTGRAICSPAITASEAVDFARVLHRRPLYWDNYPVNDLSMAGEMHLGPYRGRDPLLGHFAVGVLANAMVHAEASKVAIATIADYLWDPTGYRPDDSWRRAIRRVVAGAAGAADHTADAGAAIATDGAADAVAVFADNARASCLADSDPIELTRAIEDFNFEVQYGDPAAARAALRGRADELRAAHALLTAPDFANPALQRELQPWLVTFRIGADVVEAIARYTPGREAEQPSERLLTTLRDELGGRSHELFGDLLHMSLDDLVSSTTKGDT